MNVSVETNHLPVARRIFRIAASILLISYGAYGVYVDDLYLPTKRSPGVHLHALSAWLMWGAFICAAAALLSLVLAHYDRRGYVSIYKGSGKAATYLGWALFGLALFVWWRNAR